MRTLLAVACLAIGISLVTARGVVRRRGRKVARVPDDLSHWEQLASFDIAHSSIPVVKYRSNLTGLTIAVARAETPIVNGYFCLPTEAHDNDGLPHTLEHLVFMGSEDYPYKEVLDLLANRCLASRTNAWTAVDHTCYTVYTAGTSGFLQILPIYLDHILFPNLRKEDFATEVHHVSGRGRDAGVVYSEIQGSKYATSSSRALKEVLFPGNSGYYAQTGGNLANLRYNTTIDKVRDYHKDFYRPENLLLTITGRIDEKQLFETVRPIEEKILRKRKQQEVPEYERPWQKDLKPAGWSQENPEGFKGNHIFEMDYPSDDESKGSVTVAWRLGAHITEDIGKMEAYQLAAKYLTSSQVAPLEASFVESNDPLATSVSYFSYEYSEPALGIKFSNVPTNRTKEVVPKMIETIQKVIDDGPEKFDIERIHDYINRGLIKNQKENENSPHLFFPDASLADKIYGLTNQHFATFVTASQWTSKYLNKEPQFWIDLINEFLTRKYVAVEAHPSIKLAETQREEEEEREKRQIEDLGEEGLAAKAKELQEALDSQVLPGDDILTKIPLGDVNKIQFRDLNSFNRTLNPGNLFNFSGIPFKLHIDDVNSKFVQLYLYLETSGLTPRQQKFLPLLLDVWMSAPLIRDGEVAEIGEVIKRVNKVLLKMSISQGHSYLVIGAQAEVGKLGKGLEFIRDRFYHSHFTMKELNTTISNRLNYKKPSATTILSSLFDGLYFDGNSSDHYTDHIKQKRFLEGMREEVKEDVEAVIEEVHGLIKLLVQPKRAFLHMAGKAERLVELYGSNLTPLHSIFNVSENLLRPEDELSERFELTPESSFRKAELEKEGGQDLRHVAMGVDSSKSCYLSQTILYNNTNWMAEDVPAVRVLLRYMSDRLYHEVRGKGLTYSIAMYLSVSTGRLGLKLSKSSQLTEAYNVTRQLLQGYVDGSTTFDPALVESAKGALIYSWAEKEETVIGLIKEAARAYTRRTDAKYNRAFTRSLGGVEATHLAEAAKRFLPLFLSPDTTLTSVVCNKGNINEVVEELEKFGFDFTTYDTLEDTFLATEEEEEEAPRL